MKTFMVWMALGCLLGFGVPLEAQSAQVVGTVNEVGTVNPVSAPCGDRVLIESVITHQNPIWEDRYYDTNCDGQADTMEHWENGVLKFTSPF